MCIRDRAYPAGSTRSCLLHRLQGSQTSDECTAIVWKSHQARTHVEWVCGAWAANSHPPSVPVVYPWCLLIRRRPWGTSRRIPRHLSHSTRPVSYTHLDVYKRQNFHQLCGRRGWRCTGMTKRKHVSPEALDASLLRKQRKPIPHAFVLDAISTLSPYTRPMFGCLAIYVKDKIVLILRDKPKSTADNGVCLLYTSRCV